MMMRYALTFSFTMMIIIIVMLVFRIARDDDDAALKEIAAMKAAMEQCFDENESKLELEVCTLNVFYTRELANELK